MNNFDQKSSADFHNDGTYALYTDSGTTIRYWEYSLNDGLRWRHDINSNWSNWDEGGSLEDCENVIKYINEYVDKQLLTDSINT